MQDILFIYNIVNSKLKWYYFAFFRYKITDLPGEKAYLMDMRLMFCLNDPSPCDINVTIFENTKLLKRQCTWSTGFQDTGKKVDIFFSLK